MSSVAKNVHLGLGIVACQVRVESAKYSLDSLTNACDGSQKGTSHEPMAVQRPLICPECGPINQHPLIKCRKENGGLVVLEDHEMAALQGNDAEFKGKISLVPYDMAEVMNCTGAADKMYQIHPMAGSEANYALLAQVIAAYPSRAFVARYTIRTRASLFVASVNGSCIMLSEREFMSNLKPVPQFDNDANESFIPLAVSMVEQMDSSFNAKTFEDRYSIDLENMTRSKPVVGGKMSTTSPVAEKITADLVQEALMQYRVRKMADVAQDI